MRHRNVISGHVVYELPGGFVKIEGQPPMNKTDAEMFLFGARSRAAIKYQEAAMREQTRRRLVNKLTSGPEPDPNAERAG
jgi:hypothetical protein